MYPIADYLNVDKCSGSRVHENEKAFRMVPYENGAVSEHEQRAHAFDYICIYIPIEWDQFVSLITFITQLTVASVLDKRRLQCYAYYPI